MTLTRLITLVSTVLATCLWLSFQATAENFAEKLEAPIDRSIDTRIATQQEKDQWQRERAQLVTRYESLQREQADLKEKLEKLMETLSEQQELNRSLEIRIAEAKKMADTIQPFLETVYPRLAKLLERGLPFLTVERKDRLGNLKETLENPEISLSEKYRKTMETIFVEASYGNTTEVYQEQIRLDDNERLFSVLRLGRIALFCLSLDRETAGYYNVAESKWRLLPGKWRQDLQAAIDMAEKRRPTDLVCLPLGRLAGQ